MRPADVIVTSTEREQVARGIAQTERTDAVNAGIARSADRSADALSDGPMSAGGSRRQRRGDAAGDSPKARRPSAVPPSDEGGVQGAEDATTRRRRSARRGADADLEAEKGRMQADRHLADALGRGAAAGAAHTALDDTELEGADELYHKGRGAWRIAKGIGRRLLGTDALEKRSTLGGLSEKGSARKVTDPVEARRREQAGGYLRRALYGQPERAATTTAAGAARQAARRTMEMAAGVIRSLIGAALSVLGPVLLGIVGLVIVIMLIVAIVGGGAVASEEEGASATVAGFGDLSGVELDVAQALADAGLGRAQIAAIMGNIVGESGFNPNCEYHGEGNNYAYEYGYGLYQFTDTSGGGDEYTRFVRWCSAHGRARSDPAAQTQFFIEHLRGSWGTALHNSGYYTKYLTAFAGRNASYDAWLATDDVDFATYCVMACWLRPADWAARQSFYRDRLPAAQAYYAQLSEGGGYGQEYAASNAAQRSIVASANRTPSTGVGYCAAWVSSVYANAGLGYLGGNANDMYRAWCTSSDRSKLKVGMLVAVASSSSGTAMGAKYGHVGIYIGDNKVIHNIGPIVVWDLDTWIATYCKWSPAGWGFPPNVR